MLDPAARRSGADDQSSALPTVARAMAPRSSAATFGAVVALNVIAVANFDVLPTLVKGAEQSLNFSASDVGMLSAMIMIGAALGSVLSKYWVRRLDWRLACRISLAGMLAGNALSILLHARFAILSLQLIAGYFCGSLCALTLTILSDRPEPDRDFGITFGAQVAFQAVGLFVGPVLLRLDGIDAILGAFVVLTVGGLCVVGLLPERGRQVHPGIDFATLLRPATLLALVGASFFLLCVNCYWTFITLIGQEAGFDEVHIARSLVAAVIAGLIGALTAAWIGARLPRNAMLVCGTAMIVIAIALLTGRTGLSEFVASCCLFGFSWYFLVTYQYGVINSVDSSGHGVALTPAFQSTGGGIGTATAALIVAPHAYGNVFGLIVGGAVLSATCLILATRTVSRS